MHNCFSFSTPCAFQSSSVAANPPLLCAPHAATSLRMHLSTCAPSLQMRTTRNTHKVKYRHKLE